MNRKFCVALIALAMLGLVANSALANIIMNVKAVDGTGYTVTNGGKSVAVSSASAVIGLEVWATLTGTNTIASDEQLQTLSGGVTQTVVTAGLAGGLDLVGPGNPSGYNSPFDQSTSSVFVSNNLVGANNTITQALIWRAAAYQPSTTLGQSYLLGTLEYNVSAITSNLGQDSLNYVKPGANVGSATFKLDGTSYTGTAAGLSKISSGDAVILTVVPEPSTLILLGMGCLALLAFRRRK